MSDDVLAVVKAELDIHDKCCAGNIQHIREMAVPWLRALVERVEK